MCGQTGNYNSTPMANFELPWVLPTRCRFGTAPFPKPHRIEGERHTPAKAGLAS